MKPLHLSSILSQTPSGLLAHIKHLSERYSGQGYTLLFALSSNFPQESGLGEVVQHLLRFNDVKSKVKNSNLNEISGGQIIGCLTDSLSSVDSSSANVAFLSKNRQPVLSCSIAILNSSTCIPFYSPLHGRSQPQVGRWHSFRKKADDVGELDAAHMVVDASGKMNWEEIWNRSPSSTIDSLPEALRSTSPSNIHTLLHMSVPHPDLLTQSLAENLPSTTSLGLIAAPTHFVTGRAVTLFFNGKIHDEGAVGIALLKEDGNSQHGEGLPTLKTRFISIQRLSGPMTVTSTEGNMINSLNGSNPTQLLLQAIQLAGVSSSGAISKTFEGEEFALGVLSPSGEISRTYKITAGDPAHRAGSLSLEAPRAPLEGTVVQFIHRASNARYRLPSSLLSPSSSKDGTKQTIAFLTVPDLISTRTSSSSLTDALEPDTSSLLLPNTFLAPSHAGFVLSNPRATSSSQRIISIPQDPARVVEVKHVGNSQETWSCSLPGGMALLEWD